jgi:hypothetical protein
MRLEDAGIRGRCNIRLPVQGRRIAGCMRRRGSESSGAVLVRSGMLDASDVAIGCGWRESRTGDRRSADHHGKAI